MTAPVQKADLALHATTPFGPATIEHRTVDCGLAMLGTYVMAFHEDGVTDPWTLRYEETAYVVSGEAIVTSRAGAGDQVVRGAPGDVLVLHEGATVTYGGTTGTVLVLSITPVNWRERDVPTA